MRSAGGTHHSSGFYDAVAQKLPATKGPYIPLHAPQSLGLSVSGVLVKPSALNPKPFLFF